MKIRFLPTLTVLLVTSFLSAQVPTQWNSNQSYDNGALVLEGSGVTYMSLKDVPANMSISNRSFWVSLDSMVPTSAPYTSAPTNTPNANEVDNLSVPESIEQLNFRHALFHLNQNDANDYLVEQIDIHKYSEWQSPPLTYFGPTHNDTEGKLTYKYSVEGRITSAKVKIKLDTWNFNAGGAFGNGSGEASAWASKDGTNWINLIDIQTPQKLSESKTFNDYLPENLLGENDIYLQVRMKVKGAPNSSYTVAQFGRSSANSTNEVFFIELEYEKELDDTQQPSQPTTGVNLSNGLIAHFPFSGNAQDQSGHQNDLENRGAVLTEDRFGIKDSAYSFDGKESHLFGDIEDRKGDFSLLLWAKADEIEQSRFRSVINIFDKTPGSKDTCQIHTSGGRYPTYQFYSSNPESFALVSTNWQHLGVTVSGKVIRFYENGKPVYSQELEGGAANSFSNLIIGKNRHGGAKYHGSIDDVYVYDRAVNDAEVARIFDGGFEDSDGDGLTDEYEVGYRVGPYGNTSLRYELVDDRTYTFKDAEQKAAELGGHLATIISEDEDEAIKNALNGTLRNTVWIGGTDEKTEGMWEWVTGELWKFSNWDNGQPESTKFQGTEDFSKRYVSGVWHDWRNQERNEFFLLEYGYYTDPHNPDSDGDGHDDGKEVLAKTDPNNPFSRPIPTITAPDEGPGAPPKPDYVETIEALTETVRVQTLAIEVLEDENAALGVEVSELQASNETLLSQVETMTVEIDSLNGQVASLTQENQALSGQITNLHEDNQNLQYEVTLKTQENEQILRVAQTPFVNGWVYDDEQGWLFTDADHYPLIFSDATNSWHYYEMGSSEPRMFYSFSSEIWEAWDAIPTEAAN